MNSYARVCVFTWEKIERFVWNTYPISVVLHNIREGMNPWKMRQHWCWKEGCEPPANEVWGKVRFHRCLSVHRGGVPLGPGGVPLGPGGAHPQTPPLDTPQTPHSQQSGGTHITGMLSCYHWIQSFDEWILETTRKHATIFHRTVLFEKQKISFLSTKVDPRPHANSGSPLLHSMPSIFQQYG